jgi:hypothetical protein
MTPEYRPSHRQRWRELPLLAETALALLSATLALKLRPFRQVAQGLIRPTSSRALINPDELTARVRWAVLAAARRLPWRSVCFDQAIATQRLLARRGITADLVYGVRQTEAGYDAHVWVRLPDGQIIMGGEQASLFKPIALFRPGQDELAVPPEL